MAKTAAERQKAFRGEAKLERRRLDCWLDHRAMLALERLARHEGKTRTEVLERLLLAADDAVLRSIVDDRDFDHYLGKVTG